MEQSKPVVCIDLDGVLNDYDGWRGSEFFHPVRAGAVDFLRRLNAAGFEIVVFTVRYAPWVNAWLSANGLSPYVREVTGHKLPAHVFLDDRAVCFRGDFQKAFRHIVDFRAHWEEAMAPPHADLSELPPS